MDIMIIDAYIVLKCDQLIQVKKVDKYDILPDCHQSSGFAGEEHPVEVLLRKPIVLTLILIKKQNSELSVKFFIRE